MKGPEERRRRIGIASSGRFHTLDLAKELHALGHDIRFYSYVPKRRAASFGLPPECHVSLLPFIFPLLFWERKLPGVLQKLREHLLYKALNWAVSQRLEPCEVFIFMSGM